MNVQEHKAKDINIINYIYDEEFINLINSLSSSIKDYFKDFKQVINTFKVQTESINDQTLCAKSDINDVLLYLTQTRSKTSTTSSEKYIREKGFVISETIGKIAEVKNNFTHLIKTSEIYFLTFYDKAKEIFKKMKTTRSNKIDEINAKINFEKYIEKQNQDEPFEGGAINRNTGSQHSLDSSQNSVQKYNNSNTVGNTINVNLLSQSSEDYIKKNEALISDTTFMKFKYTELFKENQALKNMIAKMKSSLKESQSLQNSTNSNSTYNNNKTVISNVKDSLLGINQTKSRSLSKNNLYNSNNYIACNTTENEDRNSRKSNPLINSMTTKKKQSQMISKPAMPINNPKRALSIDYNKKANQRQGELFRGSSNSNTKMTINTLSTIPVRFENTTNIPLSNSNSTNHTICLNTNSNSLNNSFSNQSNLAHLVLVFLSQMKCLQESIANHQDNVKEMKKSFELKKKELIKFSESFLGIGTGSGVFQGASSTLTAINSLSTTPRNVSKKTQQQSQQIQQPLPSNKAHINTIAKLENDLAQIKVVNLELEKKIKNEKSISSLYEEKLNEEKTSNKELRDALIKAQDQIEEYTQITKTNQSSIDLLERTNKDLMQTLSEQKHAILNKENEFSNYKKANEQLQIDNSDYIKRIAIASDEKQTIVDECNTYKTENGRLKTLISECNQNIMTISNTNESIICEKDSIIKKHSETIKEKKNEINILTIELTKLKETIEMLQRQLDEEKDHLAIEKGNNENKDINCEIITGLNEKIVKCEKDLSISKQENRDIMNKISQLKNEYLSYNEERIAIQKQLIELNEETNTNLIDIQSKLFKCNQISSKSDKVKNNIIDSNNDNCIQIVNNLNHQMKNINEILEQKITEITSNDTLIQQWQLVKKELMKSQEENDKLKQITSLYQGKESVSNRNNPNKTLSNINEQNSNFIDDDLYNVSSILLEEKKDEKEAQ